MTSKIKKGRRDGFGLIEVLVVCFVAILITTLAFKQYQADANTRKVAEVKSHLSFLHQNGVQMAKKYQISTFDADVANDPILKRCFIDESGTNCDALGPRNPTMHVVVPGIALTDLQREENALINGGFNLDGTVCANPVASACAIQNTTVLNFNCTATRCSDASFQVSSRINTNNIPAALRSSLAAIPVNESLLLHDRMRNGGRSRTIASCGVAGAVGFNPANGQTDCDVTSLTNNLLFSPDFAALMQNGDLQLVSATTSGGGVTGPPVVPPVCTTPPCGPGTITGPPASCAHPPCECTAPDVIVKVNQDGSLVCGRPEIKTCIGEMTLRDGQVLTGTVGSEDLCLIKLPAGATVFFSGSVVLQAQEIELLGNLNGDNRGGAGGNGGKGGGVCSYNGCASGGGLPGTFNLGNDGEGGVSVQGGDACTNGPCTGGNGGKGRSGKDGTSASRKGQVGGGGGGGSGGGGGGYGKETPGCKKNRPRNSYVLEPGGGGGGGAGGRGGAAIQVLAGKLTAGGTISVLGYKNGGNGGAGSSPENAADVGDGGVGGYSQVYGQSLGEPGAGGNSCRGFVGGNGGTGGRGGKGGDGSIYIEYIEKVGNFSALKKGTGFLEQKKLN